MKIVGFEIEGLLDRQESLKCNLSDDLAILTGRNGAGKTSVLKLLWSIISGNILIGLLEVPFRIATVRTDAYECTVYRLSRNTCKIELSTDEAMETFEDIRDDDLVLQNAEDLAKPKLINYGKSVFFPTFRRIEGGFTITPSRPTGTVARTARARSDIEEALTTLARGLTHEPHVFVSTISTLDIVTLLLRKYADLSEDSNSLQERTSQDIIAKIKSMQIYGDKAAQLERATGLLQEVTFSIEEMERGRKNIMAPMEEVRKLVERLFGDTAIKFGSRLSFGDAAKAVNSDLLSAGEKQMLSFVCYNAFYKDAIFFIDEPELSLHVDWQRQLFSVMGMQQSSNQFIVATHSPFIYSKYPEKEIEIVADRGDGS